MEAVFHGKPINSCKMPSQGEAMRDPLSAVLPGVVGFAAGLGQESTEDEDREGSMLVGPSELMCPSPGCLASFLQPQVSEFQIIQSVLSGQSSLHLGQDQRGSLTGGGGLWVVPRGEPGERAGLGHWAESAWTPSRRSVTSALDGDGESDPTLISQTRKAPRGRAETQGPGLQSSLFQVQGCVPSSR